MVLLVSVSLASQCPINNCLLDGVDDETVNVENVIEHIGKARVAVESNANGGEGTKMVCNVEGGVDTAATGSCSGSVLVNSGEGDGAVSYAGNEPEGGADVEMDGEGKGMKNGEHLLSSQSVPFFFIR